MCANKAWCPFLHSPPKTNITPLQPNLTVHVVTLPFRIPVHFPNVPAAVAGNTHSQPVNPLSNPRFATGLSEKKKGLNRLNPSTALASPFSETGFLHLFAFACLHAHTYTHNRNKDPFYVVVFPLLLLLLHIYMAPRRERELGGLASHSKPVACCKFTTPLCPVGMVGTRQKRTPFFEPRPKGLIPIESRNNSGIGPRSNI